MDVQRLLTPAGWQGVEEGHFGGHFGRFFFLKGPVTRHSPALDLGYASLNLPVGHVMLVIYMMQTRPLNYDCKKASFFQNQIVWRGLNIREYYQIYSIVIFSNSNAFSPVLLRAPEFLHGKDSSGAELVLVAWTIQAYRSGWSQCTWVYRVLTRPKTGCLSKNENIYQVKPFSFLQYD